MKVDNLYEETQKKCFDTTQTQKQPMTLKWVIIKNYRQGNAQNMKDFIPNVETLKTVFLPDPTLKMADTVSNAKKRP